MALFARRVLSKELDITPYGFVKTSIMYGTEPILSFSNTNMVAPTAAGNQSVYNQGNDRTSFQVAQSRMGADIKANQKTRGTIEIDFIDFGQSSPTTQTRPRLRRIFIERELAPDLSVQLGQDWDTFSPLRPDTFDIIGLYFNGGNVGFMREQLKVKKKFKNSHLELSLGQTNKNAGLGNNNVEEENQLSLALNYQQKFNDKNTLVISAITGKTNYSNTQSKDPYGLTLGHQYKDKKQKLVIDAYYGKGLAQLNLLDLPGANYSESLGGYLTYQRNLTETVFVRLGQGLAKRQNAGTSTFNANKSYSNLGLRSNSVSRLAMGKTYENLQVYSEVSHFESNFGNVSKANTVEVGFLLPF